MFYRALATSHDVKEKAVGSETMRTFEKAVMLRALDHHWKEHLAVMDHLRQSVSLRGYAQKNPVQEYKRESFSMFTLLLETINVEMVKALCSVSIEQKQSSTGADAPVEKTQGSQAHNKRSPAQAQEMHNNQKGLTRLEETILALVVRVKNTNTAMGDEDIIANAL